MKVALVGQPNSGKSTLFNAVAGYRSLTSNFAGTTVEYTRGQARVEGTVLELVDLPGLYSLTPTSPVEAVSRDYLLAGDWDVIVNVIDASQMARSLELTLELLDLESPMVVCLNMMDEAARKGMTIDTHALEGELGVPVVEAIGGRGRGIIETFRKALEVAARGDRPRAFLYAPDVEGVVEDLAKKIAASVGGQQDYNHRNAFIPIQPSQLASPADAPCAGGHCHSCAGHTPPSAGIPQKVGRRAHSDVAASVAVAEFPVLPPAMMQATSSAATFSQSIIADHPTPVPAFPPARFQALQLVQSDPSRNPATQGAADFRFRASEDGPALIDWARAEIAARTGEPADAAVSAARHAACITLFEHVARVARPRADWRERVDHIAMHPIWGYVVLAGVFLGFFRLIFDVGKLGEDRILRVFDALVALLTQHMNPQSATFAAAKGALLGTAGAVAIVLPYLLPFLAGLAILEDIGYLSRVGYLMDAAMHRLGLHGTATLPILVGYGCSVPAVMATRILTSRRDRFIAAFLAVLVPCSARMTVIFALVGFYLGANYALVRDP